MISYDEIEHTNELSRTILPSQANINELNGGNKKQYIKLQSGGNKHYIK